ncbi:MAG: hypothetical protein AAGF12_35975 [Myxococcota bacterium]
MWRTLRHADTGDVPVKRALLFLFVCWPTVAGAQDAEPSLAQIHFRAATLYYQNADYTSALREFELAYELQAHPELLFNISQCHERLGNLREAVATLEQFVAETDNVEQRELNERRLENLRARLDPIEWTDEPTDDDPSPDLAIQDAEHEPPNDGVSGWAVGSLVSFGVATVGLLTFAIVGGLAVAEDSTLMDECLVDGNPACEASRTDRLSTLNTVADVGLGVGLVAAAAGVVFLIVGVNDVSSVQAGVSPDGQGSVAVRF